MHEEGEGAESKCPHWVFVSAQSPCGSPGRVSQPRLLRACGGAAAGSDFLVSVPIFHLSGPGREGSQRFPWGEGQRGRKSCSRAAFKVLNPTDPPSSTSLFSKRDSAIRISSSLQLPSLKTGFQI